MVRPRTDELRARGEICIATKRDGQPCCYRKLPGTHFCGVHSNSDVPSLPPLITCECPVCYEVKPEDRLSCGHSICEDCSAEWFKCNFTCPMCRHEVKNNPLREIQQHVDSFHEMYDVIFTGPLTSNQHGALRALHLLEAMETLIPEIRRRGRDLLQMALS